MHPYPMRFRPLLKRTIWGGTRLGDLLSKPIGDEGDYAESWEVVDHGEDQSVVENGPFAGRSLADLINECPDWFCSSASTASDTDIRHFPLLLKYLDCNRVLSVQVHPDDAYGALMTTPDLGKTEAWYIIASTPESLVYAGLKSGVDRAALRQAIERGETDQVLASFHPEPGDCLFIPAGTVHALGAGLLVAEIQQSSDTTFRLFDWNRTGADGKARPLHIEQALEVTDYDSGPTRARKSRRDVAGWQELVSCDKFILRSLESGSASLECDSKFQIVTVPRGEATIRVSEETWRLTTGQTVLLPIGTPATQIELRNDSTLLSMSLPD